MEKTVREQVEGGVAALLEACDDAARHVAAPNVDVFRSYLRDRDKRMWELVEVLKNNAELFASSEEVAKERDELRAEVERLKREDDDAPCDHRDIRRDDVGRYCTFCGKSWSH